MIKINNKVYNNYDVSVKWGDFEVCGSKQNVIGVAPFVLFNIGNKIFISIEFAISKDIIINSKLKKVVSVESDISDILYEDEKGCFSIIDEKYSCSVQRLNECNFRIKFSNYTERIKVIIDTNIKLL